MKRPRPELVAVSVCAECPFGWDGTEYDDGWRCEAKDLGDGFKAIPLTGGNAWRTQPPRWCPLRKADRLVKLRLP